MVNPKSKIRNPTASTAAPAAKSLLRPGTAMTEMVLVLPFLVFILLLVLYFGRGVVRVQHAQVMDRYEAWRQPQTRDIVGNEFSQHTDLAWIDDSTSDPSMNQVFYGNAADQINHDLDSRFPTDARAELENAAKGLSQDAYTLADDAFNTFPAGSSAGFTTAHTTDVPLWQQLDRPVTHRHTRIGNDWKFVNSWRIDDDTDAWEQAGSGPWMLPSVTRVFFTQHDPPLQNLAEQGNELASFMQSVYKAKPGYVGPTVEIPD